MLCENEELIAIKEILRKNPRGMSITDISRELNLNRNSVAKYVNMLVVAGHVEMKTHAAAKVYYLSQRVPLTAMLDFSTDSFVILDANLTIVRVNDNFLILAKTTRETLVGNSIRGTTLPVFSDQTIIEKLDDAIRGSSTVTEISWQNPLGTLYLRGKLIPTVFEDGSAALTIILENITGQIQAQQALEKSEALYRAIVEDQTELVCRFLAEGSITFMNEAALRYFRTDRSSLNGSTIRSFFADSEWEQVAEKVRDLNSANPTTTFDSRIVTPSRGTRWVQWVARAIGSTDGRIFEYQLVGRDVTELRESTALIEQALREKETLLAEVNYRIRSNLHFITSLIDLQAETRRDPASTELFREEKQQIMALARIYEILTHSDDINHIPLPAYLHKLSKDLYSTYRIDSGVVKILFQADDIRTDISSAIPVGLIFNELVSNAFKYAFPDGMPGVVSVGILKDTGGITLTIADNGIGLPDTVDIGSPKTIGMELVATLVCQINGRISLERKSGTRFTITFPYPTL
ncbi:MAG: PAS domain S-box protein [Methanoregulaceae archaeon]